MKKGPLAAGLAGLDVTQSLRGNECSVSSEGCTTLQVLSQFNWLLQVWALEVVRRGS